LVKGRNGVFEVHFENEELFSKRQLGRFPHDGEIEAILENRIQP
jgi:hypothetical protein